MKKIVDFIIDHAVLLFLCSALVGAAGASVVIAVLNIATAYLN